MMSNPDNENYKQLHQTALDRSIENCESKEDIAFHKENLERHLKEEVEDEQE